MCELPDQHSRLLNHSNSDLQVIITIERTIRLSATREEDSERDQSASSRVRSLVGHVARLRAVVAGDQQTEGFLVADVSGRGHTADHPMAWREGLDVRCVVEVVDAGRSEHGRHGVVFVPVVELSEGSAGSPIPR